MKKHVWGEGGEKANSSLQGKYPMEATQGASLAAFLSMQTQWTHHQRQATWAEPSNSAWHRGEYNHPNHPLEIFDSLFEHQEEAVVGRRHRMDGVTEYPFPFSFSSPYPYQRKENECLAVWQTVLLRLGFLPRNLKSLVPQLCWVKRGRWPNLLQSVRFCLARAASNCNVRTSTTYSVAWSIIQDLLAQNVRKQFFHSRIWCDFYRMQACFLRITTS